jgi:tetratricopeptide (TPR) repeat protein
MATASGKCLINTSVILWISVFTIGCSSLTPVEKHTDDTANAGGIVNSHRHEITQTGEKHVSGLSGIPVDGTGNIHPQVITSTGDVQLPRQAYDSAGGKIPYIPQPNPYTNLATPVPTEAKSMYVVASSLLQQGRLNAARTQFLKITEKFPSLSGPWVKLGTIAEKEEKYDEAITHYKEAINVNKNNVNAYIALGLVQRKQGYFSDAQNTYLAALDVWKDFPEAHLNLAILYDLYANKPEEAQKHYEAYSFLSGGKNEKAHKWLAEVKQRTGIEVSFIDNPPAEFAEITIEEIKDPAAAADAAIAAGTDAIPASTTAP